MALRVCIADDHRLMLEGIRKALEEADDIEIVGMTHSGADVAAMVDEQRPDLVLLDVRLGDYDGVTLLKEIKVHHPETRVVMLSGSEESKHIADAFDSGADAYVSKRIELRDLASTLRQVMGGVVFHQSPPGESSPELTAVPTVNLTERETTMLRAVCRGLSTKVMSAELFVTEQTVKFHLTNIYRKLGVHNRTGAMRYAFDNGLIAEAPESGPESLSA